MNTPLKDAPIHYQQELLAPGSVPTPSYTESERSRLRERAARLLREKDAALVAHYYTDGEIQQLAEDTGGCVADSLEMARFGHQHPAGTLVVAGVRFMGETAKILSPEKRVLMPTLEAECSLDLSAPPEAFAEFRQQYPDRTVVVYTNTSAAVKAQSDWVVTSSIALDVVRMLHQRGEKILWAPDKHLGRYIEQETGADMVIWDGACVVHEAFKADTLLKVRELHPEAAVLVHPESPTAVIELADVVGSTTQLINAVRNLSNPTFIVATDNGIFHKMKQAAPDKTLIEAPTAGAGATCESCAHCPWMAMNSLYNLVEVLETETNEIHIDEATRQAALRATQRMVDFKNDPASAGRLAGN